MQRLPQIVGCRCHEARLFLVGPRRNIDLRTQLLHQVLVVKAHCQQESQGVVLGDREPLQQQHEGRRHRGQQQRVRGDLGGIARVYRERHE